MWLFLFFTVFLPPSLLIYVNNLSCFESARLLVVLLEQVQSHPCLLQRDPRLWGILSPAERGGGEHNGGGGRVMHAMGMDRERACDDAHCSKESPTSRTHPASISSPSLQLAPLHMSTVYTWRGLSWGYHHRAPSGMLTHSQLSLARASDILLPPCLR